MHQSKTGQFFVMVQEPGGRRFTSKAEVAEFLATQDQAMAMLLGMMRLAGNHMKFWKSGRNQLKVSLKSAGNLLENKLL